MSWPVSYQSADHPNSKVYLESLSEATQLGYLDMYQLSFPVEMNVFVTAFFEVQKYVLFRPRKPTEGSVNSVQKVPSGCWYFYTLTQPAGKTEDDMRQLHALSLKFFDKIGAEPYLISLEKSSIYHTHGLIRTPGYAKNLSRDLSRYCHDYRTHVSHKITKAQEFNRVMNYIRKKGYDDDETHLEILLENKII